jgi:hypothetical protein
MELAYADAFEVKTFVLLHHLNFFDLKQRATGVPPLLLSSQCNSAMENYEAGMAAALDKPIVVLKKGSGKTALFIKALAGVQPIEIEAR